MNEIKCKITGKVVARTEEKRSQNNPNWKKRDVIVYVPSDKDPKFDNYFKISGVNDRADIIANLREGFMVEVEFFVGGRKWTKDGEDIYFSEFNMFSLKVLEQNSAEPNLVAPNITTTNTPQPVYGGATQPTNDLPF